MKILHKTLLSMLSVLFIFNSVEVYMNKDVVKVTKQEQDMIVSNVNTLLNVIEAQRYLISMLEKKKECGTEVNYVAITLKSPLGSQGL